MIQTAKRLDHIDIAKAIALLLVIGLVGAFFGIFA